MTHNVHYLPAVVCDDGSAGVTMQHIGPSDVQGAHTTVDPLLGGEAYIAVHRGRVGDSDLGRRGA